MKKVIEKLIQKMNWVHAVLLCLVFLLICIAVSYVNGNTTLSQFKEITVNAIILGVIVFWIYKKNASIDEAIKENENASKELEKSCIVEEEVIFYDTPNPKASPYGTDFVINVKAEQKSVDINDIKETIDNMKITRSKPEKQTTLDKPTPIVKEGESKAEKEGNVIIGTDGKPIVKPNYKMIASEWVRNNLELLNKICNDAYAISGGSGAYSATIPATFLPEEKASWIIIGKTLVAEDDISSFKILKDGLQVTVS